MFPPDHQVQLEEAVAATDIRLSPEELAYLEEM
jgi:hypothetical protein